MRDTPDSKRNISVLVSAPTFDLSPYHLFSEDIFQHTVDKILSDEGSFEGNFDDYSPIHDQGKNGDIGSGVDDKQGHDQKKVKKRDMQEQKQRRNQNRKEPKRTNAAGGTRSKYFIKETIDGIPCIDLESSPDPESPVEERENGKNADTNTNMDTNIPSLDDNTSALVDDSAVEDIIFSSVSSEVRDKLLHFIVSHPFARKAQYPVRRSARRRFVDDIRGEAAASGMDEGSIAGLIGYVRNTYLELYGNRTGLPGGSTFGEEIDDDGSAEEKSDGKKRKWLSGNKKREESRSGRPKKRVSKVSESGSPGPRNSTQTGDIGAETVQVEHIVFGPASAASMSSAENASNIHNDSEQNSHVSGDCSSTAEQAGYPPNGFDEDAQVQEAVTMHESGSPLRDLNGEVEVPEQLQSHKRPSESILEKQTLCLPLSETLDGPMTPSKTPNDEQRRRRERNLRKRLARKRRRAEKRLRLNLNERETNQPVGQLSAGVDDIERDTSSSAPPMSDDSQGVTTCDETQTQPDRCFGHKVHFIPDQTRELLEILGLPGDFLSSDSPLSDVASDVNLPDDTSSFGLLKQNSTVREQEETLPIHHIQTPASSPVKSSRVRLPKVSPYFPKPLAKLDSCLPFRPIDASAFGLIQEQLAHDPFRLLVATIFLNRTRGGVALSVLFQVFERFPTIEDMAAADHSELVSMIHCLGFQNQRAKKCIDLARTWLINPPAKGKRYRKLHYPRKLDGRDMKATEYIDDDDPRVAWEIAHLPGLGAYALDSWRIFCRDELRGLARDWNGCDAESPDFQPEWKSVLPQDKELRAYLTWMWLKEGWVWDRHTGERTRASEKTMRAARQGGIAYEDNENGNWVLEMSPMKPPNNGFIVDRNSL